MCYNLALYLPSIPTWPLVYLTTFCSIFFLFVFMFFFAALPFINNECRYVLIFSRGSEKFKKARKCLVCLPKILVGSKAEELIKFYFCLIDIVQCGGYSLALIACWWKTWQCFVGTFIYYKDYYKDRVWLP